MGNVYPFADGAPKRLTSSEDLHSVGRLFDIVDGCR